MMFIARDLPMAPSVADSARLSCGRLIETSAICGMRLTLLG